MSDDAARNNLRRALDRITKPNAYNEIIKQVTPTVIPVRFIQYVTVLYNNGKTVELKGTDITEPVPVKQYMSKEERQASRAQMADVKVFIDTEALGEEIENSIDNTFRKYKLL